ncbi:PAS domain S-box protein [Parasphingorhabdus pacifica]
MDATEPNTPMPWEAVWKQLAGPIAILSLDGGHIDVNPAMCEMLGYTREQFLSFRPADVTHPQDEQLNSATIARMIESGTDSLEVEKRLIRSDGSFIVVLVSSTLVRKPSGEPGFIVSQLHDITSRRESQLLWKRTLENAPIGIALLDLDGFWTEVNDRLCDLVGYSREELRTMHLADLTGEEDQNRVAELLEDLRLGRRTSGSLEVLYRHRGGQTFWMLIRLSVMPDANDQPAYVISQYDAIGGNIRMSAERLAQLTRMAMHDPLTGVANRALLIDRFDHGLAELPEHDGVLVVLLIDLNDLKPVNDRYGHAFGDQLLETAAHQISSVVRSSDTVARIGGDEFVVLTSVDHLDEAEQLRHRVTQRLNTEVGIFGRTVRMSASVGLATTRSTATSAEELLHNADRDMYARKDNPR